MTSRNIRDLADTDESLPTTTHDQVLVQGTGASGHAQHETLDAIEHSATGSHSK